MINEEIKQELILSLLGIGNKTPGKSFYQLGKVYVFRTVTMIYLGTLKEETEKEFILTDCAWIPDTSRWNEFLKGKNPNEMEPYANDVIIYKGAMLDATELVEKISIEVI